MKKSVLARIAVMFASLILALCTPSYADCSSTILGLGFKFNPAPASGSIGYVYLDALTTIQRAFLGPSPLWITQTLCGKNPQLIMAYTPAGDPTGSTVISMDSTGLLGKTYFSIPPVGPPISGNYSFTPTTAPCVPGAPCQYNPAAPPKMLPALSATEFLSTQDQTYKCTVYSNGFAYGNCL